MAKPIRNMGASVRDRLLETARSSGKGFELLLTQFVLERIMHRLEKSPYADQFVLKGGMLLMAWLADRQRPTKDLDLLGFGKPDATNVLEKFRYILAMESGDGVEFDLERLSSRQIRPAFEDGGLRLQTRATVGGAHVRVTIDIGFGDALVPGPEFIDYPTLLDFPSPRVRAYAKETLLAEKFHAIVHLGLANTRIKDYYDIWALSQSFPFDDGQLALAIAHTFRKRGTKIPVTLPAGLGAGFYENPEKQALWRALAQTEGQAPEELADVVRSIGVFIMAHAEKATEGKL